MGWAASGDVEEGCSVVAQNVGTKGIIGELPHASSKI